MDRRQLLALLASTGTAGCLRMVGSGQSSPNQGTTVLVDGEAGETAPTATTTPAAAETSPETGASPSSQQGYPAGLSDDGVSVVLFDSHKRELAQTSFHTTFTAINLQNNELKQQRDYEVDTGFALGSWLFDDGGPVTMFRSHEGGFWREDLGSKFTYGEARQGYSINRVTWGSWLEPVISAGQWGEPTTIQEGNPPLWQVETIGFAETGSVPGWFTGTLEALSGSLTVGPRGIIYKLDAEFEASKLHGGVAHFEIKYRVDSVGEVSVSQPSWLPTAKDRRPEVTAALTDDRKFVRWTLESGNPIEPNTRCSIHDNNARAGAINYFLRDPIEPGETVYFYKEQEELHAGQIARGSRPSDASPVTLDSEYHTWADRNGTEYFGTIQL